MHFPTALIHQRELDEQIERIKPSLGPEVLHVAYRIREDSTEVPSIFFRITMRDESVTENVIVQNTERVIEKIVDEIRPLENWGLRYYFNFRSSSDQQRRPDTDWV